MLLHSRLCRIFFMMTVAAGGVVALGADAQCWPSALICPRTNDEIKPHMVQALDPIGNSIKGEEVEVTCVPARLSINSSGKKIEKGFFPGTSKCGDFKATRNYPSLNIFKGDSQGECGDFSKGPSCPPPRGG